MLETVFRLFILISFGFLLIYFKKEKKDLFYKLKKEFKENLFLSLPIGTIILILINLFVYLFIQKGLWHFQNPLWLPFTSAGFFNFIGTLIGALTHVGPSHLFSNLFGTALFAPFAELIFVTNKKQTDLIKYLKGTNFYFRGLEKIFSTPWIRAMFLFPLTWILIGVFNSISSPLGIGFSGVFFAILGLIIILKPILAITIYLIEIIIENALRAFSDPITISKTGLELTKPIWVNLGVWAHVIGFLTGILFGLFLFFTKDSKKEMKPNPSHVFFAIIILGLSKGLDWLFKIEYQTKFVLFSGAGFIFLLMIAFLSSQFWGTYREINFSYLGDKSKGLGKIISLFQDHRVYLALLLVILIFMSTFMFVSTSISQPTSPINNSARYGDYVFWYEKNNGLLVYNKNKNIYALIVSDKELDHDSKHIFYVGNVFYDKKITVNQLSFKSINGNKTKSIWISKKDEKKNLFISDFKGTGLSINNSSLEIKYLKNNSLLLKTKNNWLNTTILIKENNSINYNKKNMVLKFVGKDLVLKINDMKTIIGEVNKFPESIESRNHQ